MPDSRLEEIALTVDRQEARRLGVPFARLVRSPITLKQFWAEEAGPSFSPPENLSKLLGSGRYLVIVLGREPRVGEYGFDDAFYVFVDECSGDVIRGSGK